MLHASTRKLIDRLSEMTELGKLDWTESEDGTLAYATEGYSVSLTESPNELIITSKNGTELERANAEELATTQQEDGTAYTSVVAAMTMEASRVARGTEAAISSLLADLQDAPDPAPADMDVAQDQSDEDLQEDQVNETTAIVTQPATPAETIEQVEASTAADTPTAEENTVDDVTEPAIIAASQANTNEAETSGDEEVTETEASESTYSDAAEPQTDIETAAEETAPSETETESDVTEAVARLADQVNQREESSLGAAAASAAGAVALAAGLTPLASTEEDDTTTNVSETEEAPIAVIAAETDDRPAYIPFGLEPEDDTDTAPLVAAEVTVDAPPEPVEIEAPIQEEQAPISFAATETIEPTRIETSWNEVEPEPQIEAELPVEAAAIDEVVPELAPESEPAEMAMLSAASDQSNSASDKTVEALEEVPSEIAAMASAEDAVEAETAPKVPAPDVETVEPEAPKTYSLSGIGAGFGLGALSAKTEASGIPAPNSSRAAPPEKIIIDATDDVLPELEGNLNVSLAETASAAVSAANAAPAAAEPAEAPKDAETDILKPRTRFNPWD